MLTAAQVAIRSTGIGASEVSSVLALNPYAAPIDVWLAKTGRVQRAANDVADESPIAVGDELEGALLAMLGRRVGLDFTRPQTTFRHPRARHVLASPDGLALGRRGGEIKVVGSRMAHHWSDGDELPDYVRTQAVQNMAVLGADVWHIGALIGGSSFRTFTIEKDRELEQLLVDAVETFWSEHVETDTPPPVADPEERRRYLLARYPGSESQRCRLVNDPIVAAAAERLREIDADVKALEGEAKALQNDLCALVGDDYGIEGRWGKALWYPTSGAPTWREIAEELAGGEVPSAVIEAHRGEASRTFRLYAPPKNTKGRRR